MTLYGADRCDVESDFAPSAASAGAGPDPTANAHAAIATRSAAARERSALGEKMGDRQEEEEDAAERIHADDDASSEVGPQGRMAEEVLESQAEHDDENREEHERPPAKERDDGDHAEDREDDRVIPIEPAPGSRQTDHRSSPETALGGNVWESNPPRTSKTPDERI